MNASLPEPKPDLFVSTKALLGSDTEREWNLCLEKLNTRITALIQGNQHRYYFGEVRHISAEVIRESFLMLQGLMEVQMGFLPITYHGMDREYQVALEEFWSLPELLPVHLTRFFALVGEPRRGPQEASATLHYTEWMESFLPVYFRLHPEVGLLELGWGYDKAGLDSKRLGSGFLIDYCRSRSPFGLPDSRVWPYWAAHLDLLSNALQPITGDHMVCWNLRHMRGNAFYALASFPETPEQLIPQIWKIAMGPKNLRPAAQRCLERLPDKIERLVAELKSGSQESRQAAAEWLASLGDPSAISPLVAAFKKEKTELTKGAIMSALKTLGAPLEQFLDRKGLLAEAVKGLEKGIPKDLEWFPFQQLPAVHWAMDATQVNPEIIRWWLVQGYKLRSAEPGVLLRKYSASFHPSESQALGKFVLEAWLAEDVATIPMKEAEEEALDYANRNFPYLGKSKWIPEHIKTFEALYAYHLADTSQRLKGSAISSKGILSVAAAMCGPEVVPGIHRYIKQWFGMRVNQCRALLQVLAWIDHKAATQLVLAIATRFRTPSIQEEAHQQAIAIAERKGWSVNELADRTIPTACLDAHGILTLDFGPRHFTANLTSDMILLLKDEEGKQLKTLPEPRTQDDQEKAAEAKKVFTASKKELKSVLTSQTARLYEAMCVQRAWSFEEWNSCLNLHAIVRHLCQRLSWCAVDIEKKTILFRPMADGSLTDATDEPLRLESSHWVRVAHEMSVNPQQSMAWQKHFKDYEIEPPFQQFGRPTLVRKEEHGKLEALLDFQGFMVDAFKLRARATKLGYNRGQTEEGGWFYSYSKRFSSLGLEVVLEFTGNSLPEENRKTALKGLRIVEISEESGHWSSGTGVIISEVPPVLLAECWSDWKEMAADGSGFDPDWITKTQP